MALIDPQYEDPEAILNQTDENGRALLGGAFSKTEIEVLDLLSEGEVEGLVEGEYKFVGVTGHIGYDSANLTLFTAPSNAPNSPWLRSIYWNEVPVINSNGKYNFQAIDTSFTKGTPNGSLIYQTNPELTITRTLNERLRGLEYGEDNQPIESKDFSKIYRILNPVCKAAIVNVKVHQLYESLREEKPGIYKDIRPLHPDGHIGDVRTTFVEYIIKYRPVYSNSNATDSTPDFGNPTPVKIEGKVTSPYLKGTRINFIAPASTNNPDQYFIGWEVKITRTTPESQIANKRNQTTIDSLTEVYSDIFSYPHSAIVRQKFDAEYFNQVPDRAFDTKLIKVKIPSNYEPIKKTYTEGVAGWDGTFLATKKWTDNPAWFFYDLATNPRYGLGRYIEEGLVDKWSLYEISKYCDTLVEDGNGGIE